MSIYGLTECIECGREYECAMTDGSYDIHGYTKREYYPVNDRCTFCRGESECSDDSCSEQATVYDKEGCEVYCSHHWEMAREGSDCTKEEWEEFCFRLDPSYVDQPKETTGS